MPWPRDEHITSVQWFLKHKDLLFVRVCVCVKASRDFCPVKLFGVVKSLINLYYHPVKVA